MEYLTDGSLYDKWQENNKQLPEKAVAKLIGDVCRGLKTLHKSEIIHRDIKLYNVLVEKVIISWFRMSLSADEALKHPFLSNYMDEIKLVLKTAWFYDSLFEYK